MYNEVVHHSEQLPAPENIRKSTDVCCTWLGAVFALTMFLIAAISFNRDKINRTYFSLYFDENGVSCNPNTQYVSFINMSNSSMRECVLDCDKDYRKTSSRVCWPLDGSLQQQYEQFPQIVSQKDYQQFGHTLFWSTLIAISIGVIYLTITHCGKRSTPLIAIIFAIVSLSFIAIYVLVNNSQGYFKDRNALKYSVVGLCLFLIALFATWLTVYTREIKFQGIMLEYSTIFLSECSANYFYLIIYLIFNFALTALIVFQHFGFTALGTHSNFMFDLSNAGLLGVLNIIEYIWGLQFLKNAFNFCISGNAVDWYWNQNISCDLTFRRLLCKNWGSVVGGSFLNAFFQVPTLIIELLTCHPEGCCSSLGTTCYNCSCIGSFFLLVRTDAYAYQNLSGIPFCNSARQCEKLCYASNQYLGCHSAIKHYRLAAHIFCVSFTFILSFFILNARVQNISCWHLIILIGFTFSLITWFINLHADAGEGIEISFLAEHFCCEDYKYMQKAYASIRRNLEENQDKKKPMDGNC